MAQDKIELIPLSSIVADFAWNGRYIGGGETPGWTQDSGDENGNDFSELKGSIAAVGQDTPVIVRPKGQKFALVSGFRRFLAIKEIAEEKKEKEPTIKAIVRQYDELEARLANVRENTERDDYRPADLTWAVGQTMLQYQKKNIKVTQQMLAGQVGKAQSYIAKMIGICENLDPRILDDWRTLGRDISIQKVYDLSLKLKKDQLGLWAEMKKAAADRAAGSGGGDTGSKAAKKLESLKEQASKLGTLLGKLVREEILLPPSGEEVDAVSVVQTALKLPKDYKASDTKKVGRAFKAAFEAALVEEEDEEEEESAEAAQ